MKNTQLSESILRWTLPQKGSVNGTTVQRAECIYQKPKKRSGVIPFLEILLRKAIRYNTTMQTHSLQNK
jgi:hypothetical protein